MQNKKISGLESIVQTAVGFVLAYLLWYFYIGENVRTNNFNLTDVLDVIYVNFLFSFMHSVRGYIVRRIFSRYQECGQSKKRSVWENVANGVIGFIIACLFTFFVIGVVFRHFGIDESGHTASFFITCFFTILTLIRTYYLRRLFVHIDNGLLFSVEIKRITKLIKSRIKFN